MRTHNIIPSSHGAGSTYNKISVDLSSYERGIMYCVHLMISIFKHHQRLQIAWFPFLCTVNGYTDSTISMNQTPDIQRGGIPLANTCEHKKAKNTADFYSLKFSPFKATISMPQGRLKVITTCQQDNVMMTRIPSLSSWSCQLTKIKWIHWEFFCTRHGWATTGPHFCSRSRSRWRHRLPLQYI